MFSAPIFLAALTVGRICGWLLAAVGVLVFFGLTILIHEGGHFLAAKALGLRADTFSLGFGPALWKKRWRGTEYRLSAIPFGGYVALPQLDPIGMENIQGSGKEGADKTKKEFATPLPPAAWWKRILVAAAGPFGNVVFAVLLAFVVRALPPPVPEPLQFGGAVVGEVAADSDAARAGLRAGDLVLSVAGKPVPTWSDFVTETHLLAESDRIAITVSNLYDGAVADLSAALSQSSLGYFTVSGMVQAAACGVGELLPGGAAAAADLRKGDVVLSVDGRRPASPLALSRLLAEASDRGAERVSLRVYRDGETLEAILPLTGEPPTALSADRVGLGAVVDAATNLVETSSGERPPADGPLQAGDIVLSVDGAVLSGGWPELAWRLGPAARAGREVEASVSNLFSGATSVARFVPEAAPGVLGMPPGAEPAPLCLVEGVFDDSPAAEAGIGPGEALVALSGEPVLSFSDFQGRVRNSGGRTMPLTILATNGILRTVDVTPRFLEADSDGTKHFQVGILLVPVTPPREVWSAFLAGIEAAPVEASVPQWARERAPGAQLKGDAKSIWRVLGPIFGKAHKGERARIGKALGGPVTILSSMWIWFLTSFTATLAFVRFLNVNLAIINLLPIPVLDGGHIVFALWRGITRRELPARVIEVLVNAFTLLILLLFGYLCVHDVWSLSKLFGGH